MSRQTCLLGILFLLLSCSSAGYAQFNPYSKMTDPRAIARLDGIDNEPLRYVNRFGYPQDRDLLDSNFILASDTGTGVITHIWTTTTAADSTTSFKLYVDNKLIYSGTYFAFFDKAHGVIRPPFDSLYPGANVCDVQIPYKKNFRITYIGEGWNIYYAIAWRPITDSASVLSFEAAQPFSVQYHQIDAESIYHQFVSPWGKEKPAHYLDTSILAPSARKTILDIKGPAMIQKLQFAFSNPDFDLIDSLWLDIFWDGSPFPAVHVPLADFFCTSNGSISMRSFAIQTDSGVLTCTFPMPFAVSAKIVIENSSTRIIDVRTSVNYDLEPIAKNKYGYFHAHFSESNPTRYHIYHAVLSQKGRGRLVGFYHYSPKNHEGVILEGDPVYTVDSSSRNNFRYTGGEDYYNSGWWFFGIMFSKPFAGHVNFMKAFYRFHILDAIDFKKSIDVVLQPGASTDLMADFRTVAYYYKQPTSFWTSRDTIKAGERWNVAGSGYMPNATIFAKFDGDQQIFSTTANASGEFNAYLIVPFSAIHGARKLSINDEVRPEPIYFLSSASLRSIADSLPVTLRCQDSLLITGSGFDPGENISIFLDSILVSGSQIIKAGNDYRFFATVRMPNIAAWKYHLRAVGDHHNEAMAEDLVEITRLRRIEFEDLITTAKADTGWFYYAFLSAVWGYRWSHQATATFEPLHPGEMVRFTFTIPASDTFDVRLFLSSGMKYGIYSYSIDGKNLGTFNGYLYDSWNTDNLAPSDTIKIGTLFLAKDSHTVVFTCLGKDTAAKDYRLGADMLMLRPTTIMALPKGVFTTPKNDSGLSIIGHYSVLNSIVFLYPNPVSGGTCTVGINTPPENNQIERFDVILSDVLGRQLASQRGISMTPSGTTTKFDLHGFTSGNYLVEFVLYSNSEVVRIPRMLQIRE